MDNRNICILGSTGSIGIQALDVCRFLGYNITALSANKNIDLLEKQLREFSPRFVAVSNERSAKELAGRVRDMDVIVLAGDAGICEISALPDNDIVLNAIVGLVGLHPTLAAIAAKKTVALANKESLVTGGELVMREAVKNGVRILPVDSEHSAIFQCLQGNHDIRHELKRIILTASGGPFFGKKLDELKDVTSQQALRHPNWSMGDRITIDSATLMNKGMELIEAVWLFGVKPEQVDVIIHRESVLHSAVEYRDRSVIAQLGVPDMKIPIQYALTWPQRQASEAQPLDLIRLGSLTFAPPDEDTFRCLRICRQAIRRGGLLPAVINGADEIAVDLFLKGKISFTDIPELVESASGIAIPDNTVTYSNILKADALARQFVLESIE